MAAEVKKRMDEAQREMERNALSRGTEEDEDEEDDYGVNFDERRRDNRGVHAARERDRDLLEGAEVMSVRERDEGGKEEKERLLPSTSSSSQAGRGSGTVDKVEFES